MNIGFLLFDGLTQLDLTGPLQIFSRLPDANVMTIAKRKMLIKTDCPIEFMPTHDFATAPNLDLICVPGGRHSAANAIRDHDILTFVKDQGSQATYVTSVCTGSLILGAAGLLKGRRATSHWAYCDLLTIVGATYQTGRVVKDGNLYTGGGVTAGIDFALTITREVYGDETAQALQLGFEYDPEPPFQTGHPTKAPQDLVERLTSSYETIIKDMAEALESTMTTGEH